MTTEATRRLARRILPEAQRVRQWVAPVARCIDSLARFGYVARGAVYVSVGGISLLASLAESRRAEGPVGALETWAAWPPGILLLWTAALGLIALAAWRFLQAVFDADRVGLSRHGVSKRASKAGDGLVDLALGVSVFRLLGSLAAARDVDDQAGTQALVDRALAIPGGGLLLVAIGLGIGIAGATNVGHAATGHFTKDLDCTPVQARWAGVLARIGHVAKGVGLAAVGLLTGLAGWEANADHARGLGGALEAVKDQPMGHVLLAVLGVGFMAYGVFDFAKAGLRRIGG